MKKTVCRLNLLVFTPVVFIKITVFCSIHLEAVRSGRGERFKLPPDYYAFCLLKINYSINFMSKVKIDLI